MEERKTYAKRKKMRPLKGAVAGLRDGLQTSKDGLTNFLKFVLVCNSKDYFLVTCFKDQATEASEFNIGDLVKVYGADEQEQDENGYHKFVANSVGRWSIQEEVERQAREYLIQTYGTLEKYYALRKAQDEALLDLGLTRVTLASGDLAWVPRRYSDGSGRLLVDRLIEVGGKEFIDDVRAKFAIDKPGAWLPYLHTECQKRGITTPDIHPSVGGMETAHRTNPGTQTETKEGPDGMDKDRPLEVGTTERVGETASLLAQIEGEL